MSPMDYVQARLDNAGVPVNIKNNHLRNLMAGVGIVMYWGAMWNLLDAYFLIRLVPNPVANSALRVAVGLAFLAFPDNDIKEIGDKWDGLDGDDDGDEDEDGEGVGESSGGDADAPPHQRKLDPAETLELLDHALAAGRVGLDWPGDDAHMTRDQVLRLFLTLDANHDGCISMTEVTRNLRLLSATSLPARAKGAAKKSQHGNNDDANGGGGGDDDDSDDDSDDDDNSGPCGKVDRFELVEKFLLQYGLDLDLHNHYFQNLWLGTGIITVWSGLENLCNHVLWPRAVPHPLANNLLRIALAAAILYFPSGNLHDMGDGFLEDGDEDGNDDGGKAAADARLSAVQAAYVAELLTAHTRGREHGEVPPEVVFSLRRALAAFDEAKARHGRDTVTTRELLAAVVRRDLAGPRIGAD